MGLRGGERPFWIGEYWIDPELNTVSADGERASLEPRAMDLLVYLAQHPSETVSVDSIVTEVWAGRVIGDNAVYQAVAQIRKALGDRSDDPRFIATVPKRGYRLIANVRVLETPEQPANAALADNGIGACRGRVRRRWIAVIAVFLLVVIAAFTGRGVIDPSPAPEETFASIAVLPFGDASADANDAYLAFGLADEFRNALAQVRGLRVAGRVSSNAYTSEQTDFAEMGRHLDVQTLLLGQLQRDGQTLRLATRLVVAADGRVLWADEKQHPIDDLFLLENGIVEQVLISMGRSVPGGGGGRLVHHGTETIGAYDYHLLGRHHMRSREQASLEKAVGMFRQSLALDGEYAESHALLAICYLLLAELGVGSFDEWVAAAQASLERALEFGEDDPSIATAEGLMHDFAGRYELAEVAFRRAVALNPNHASAHGWLGVALESQGKLLAAQERYREALRLDPLNENAAVNLGRSLARSGDVLEGLRLLHRAADTYSGSSQVHRSLSGVFIVTGDYARAVQWGQSALRLDPTDARSMAALAEALLYAGRLRQAKGWIDRALGRAPGNAYVSMVNALYAFASNDHEQIVAMSEGRLVNGLGDGNELPPASQRFIDVLAGHAKLMLGDLEDARRHLEFAISQRDTTIYRADFDVFFCGSLAYIYKLTGRLSESEDTVEQCWAWEREAEENGWSTPYMLHDAARLSAISSDPELAIMTLRNAFERGYYASWMIQQDPTLESLRGDPRFGEIVAGMEQVVAEQLDDAARRSR